MFPGWGFHQCLDTVGWLHGRAFGLYRTHTTYRQTCSSRSTERRNTHTHTHNHFTALFRDYSGEPVPEEIFWTFMVQGKITEADTPTIWMGATPSGLINDPPSSLPHPQFLCRMPFLLQPSHFLLAWDRHQTCWLAYPVAW